MILQASGHRMCWTVITDKTISYTGSFGRPICVLLCGCFDLYGKLTTLGHARLGRLTSERLSVWIVRRLAFGFCVASSYFYSHPNTRQPMRPFLAIAWTTIRSAIRSHVVHLVLVFLALTVVVLPLVVTSDGSAKGLIQVSLTYTMSLVGILLSMITVWLGCTTIADDVEQYQAHMVLSKPVPRGTFWVGKLIGILILQGSLLVLAAASIYLLTMWRFNSSTFSDAEKETIQNEVLVGRVLKGPEMPDLAKEVNAEFQRRLDTGAEMTEGLSERMIKETIRNQMVRNLSERKANEMYTPWVFRDVPVSTKGENVYLRFRLYVSSAKSKEQRPVSGEWITYVEIDGQIQPAPLIEKRTYMGGIWHQLPLPKGFIEQSNGQINLGFFNWDTRFNEDGMAEPGESVHFQLTDGPYLMTPKTGFLANFCRVVILMFCQIAFLGIIACVAGALLSTPVAVFMSFSYIFIGMILSGGGQLEKFNMMAGQAPLTIQVYRWAIVALAIGALFIIHVYPEATTGIAIFLLLDMLILRPLLSWPIMMDFGDDIVKGGFMTGLAVFRNYIRMLMVSINEFNMLGHLSRGQLIEFSAMKWVIVDVVLRMGLPIVIVGNHFLKKRELGLVIRR